MKDSPLTHFFHALWAGALFCLISSYSILSTENMIMGGDGQNVRPSFEVFQQMVDVWRGVYSGMLALAILSAFFLWFCWTGIGFFFEHYKMHLESQQKGAGGTFITVIGALLAVDSYANWSSVSKWPWPWYWQLVATTVIAAVLMWLGHFAIFHFLKAVKGMKGA